MYLEISERGTGKTHRLIESVISHLETPNGFAIVVSEMFRHLSRRLAMLPQERLFVSHTMKTKFPIPVGAKVRYFVDDFDSIRDENLIVSPTGYYVSTLVKEHPENSFFWQLLRESKGKFITHISLEGRRTFYHQIGKEAFERQTKIPINL